MLDLCIELVIYNVTNEQEAINARRQAMPIVEQMKGFKSWTALQATDDKSLFADYATWATCDDAKAAAKQFETDKRFVPFAKTIKEIKTFHHYKITDRK